MSKTAQLTDNFYYQFKVMVAEAKQPIWRRVVVNSNISLINLHEIIKSITNWSYDYIFDFTVNRTRYIMSEEGASIICLNDMSDHYRTVNDILVGGRKTLSHDLYYGNHYWRFKVILEKVLLDFKGRVPCCIAGKNDFPMEGYIDIEEYNDEVKDVSGSGEFNLDEANELMLCSN